MSIHKALSNKAKQKSKDAYKANPKFPKRVKNLPKGHAETKAQEEMEDMGKF